VAVLLEKELRLIADLEYEHFFLTVNDVVDFARRRGILCQGRGSAANSAVCYALGITEVDPARMSLLVERFISRERREPPDIDVDFEHERREEVIQYIYAKYGRERTALAATVITYQTRSARRDVERALGIGRPAALAAGLIAELRGFPRHLSQHVGGFVISGEPLHELVPIENAAMPERTVIQWDKDDLETLGLLKVDVLALGMLTAIRKALALIQAHRGWPGRVADIPAEDRATYDMICRGETVGVFQIESRAQMSMLPRLRPRSFYDLVIEVAIIRPGPIQGGMVHPYLQRRQDPGSVRYPSPALAEVLRRTLGVPIFQEQVMQIAVVAAGFTAGEADQLRRSMAAWKRRGGLEPFRERLLTGMSANGYSAEFAESIYRQILGFGEYGFPESHAASFALLTYFSCWLKCHEPAAFFAALLNSQPMGFYQPAQLVRDARQHGVEVREADVNFSEWDCTLESMPPDARHRYSVRLGFRQIQGLSEEEIKRLVAARGNGYAGIERLAVVAGVSRFTIERLAEADAFRSLGLDRRAALWAARRLDTIGIKRTATKKIKKADQDPAAHADLLPLLAPHASDELFPEPQVMLPAMPLCEHVAEDYVATGLSLKAHPISFFRDRLAKLGVIDNAEHRSDKLPQGSMVTVAGLVLIRQMPGTAKGVVFATLEDETDIANIIVWPKVFEKNRRTVMTARFLVVRGRLQRVGLVVHVVAQSFVDLSAELRRLRDGDLVAAGSSDAQSVQLDFPLKSRDFH